MNITLPAKVKAFPFYIFFAWFGFFAWPLYAQQKFNVLHFNSDNFLPQNSVSRVAFDKHGYTWLCTQLGLVRYDGSHFRTYNTFNTPAIKNNRFTFVANDVNGNIYALDGRPGVLQVTDTGFIERKDLVANDASGNIYALGGRSKDRVGLDNCFFLSTFVNLKDLAQRSIPPFQYAEPFNDSNFLKSFFYIDSSRFYFASQRSTGYYDGSKLYTNSVMAPHKAFMSGGLLFAMVKNDTYDVYKEGRQVASGLEVTGDIVENTAYKKFGITSIAFNADPDSNAYIFLNHALYLLTGNESGVTSKLICDSLEATSCYYIAHNALTGAFYICSQAEGLYVLEPADFKSLLNPSVPGSSRENIHYAAIEVGKNRVLSGNNYIYENGNVSTSPLNMSFSFSLYSDANHHLFFQKGHTIYETDTFNHLLSSYPLDDIREVKCLKKDGKGDLWVAVNNKFGVLENGAFHFYLSGPPYEEMESFIFQHDSLVWLATRAGLFLFHINDKRVEEIKELKGNYVRTLKLDDDGTLWIGTYGQGFYRYKNRGLVKFPADRNGYLSIAHCFMEDKNGFFWIPTNHGLFQAKKSDLNDYADGKLKALYYQYYDKSSGFATNEFNGGCEPCGIRISDGSFILPSIYGLVKFIPEAIHPLLPSGEIFIDKITADSLTYQPSGFFELKAGFQQLVFEISSVYYGNKYNNNTEYRVKGFNETWYPLNEDGIIRITTLPHGSFELQLRRLAGFGRENYVYKNIAFSVAPNMYETPWFMVLIILFAVLFIWFGFRIRYNLLKKQKRLLQKQVKERTAALEQSVEELHQSENALYSSIQQKEKIASILLHDLKSPLRFLTLVSDHIHSQIDHGKKDELKKLTQDMMNSSRRISLVTDEFLAWLITDYKDYTVSNQTIFLKPLADEIAEFFGELVESNHNILDVDVKENLKVIADERLLRVILRNLVDNANKHTRKGTISLKAFGVNGTTEIKVSDTGQGMTDEQLKSFSNANTNTPGFSLHIGNQLGSRIIRDFIHKLGGSLTVTSETGKGTTITLFLKN